MSNRKFIVELSSGERDRLKAVLNSKKPVSREKRTRARILLKVDEGKHGPGWTDAKTADAFDVHVTTVELLRKRLVEAGFQRALERKKQARPSVVRKLDGAAEARLIATVQGPAPEGRSRWSLRLLSDRVVELGISRQPISYETIRQTLKKTR